MAREFSAKEISGYGAMFADRLMVSEHHYVNGALLILIPSR